MSSVSKFSEKLLRFARIGQCCFLLGSISPEPITHTITADFCAPSSGSRLEMDAFVIGRLCLKSVPVGIVLGSSARSKILPSVIQAVAVDMIDFFSCASVHCQSMQVSQTIRTFAFWVTPDIIRMARFVDVQLKRVDEIQIVSIDKNAFSINHDLRHARNLTSTGEPWNAEIDR